jgi:hypothetical protein
MERTYNPTRLIILTFCALWKDARDRKDGKDERDESLFRVVPFKSGMMPASSDGDTAWAGMKRVRISLGGVALASAAGSRISSLRGGSSYLQLAGGGRVLHAR